MIYRSPWRARSDPVIRCAGIALVLLAGCSRGPGIQLVPVSGKVTYNGRPLTTGSLSFQPESTQGGTNTYEPAGAIDGEGNYTLFTAGKQGAPPGRYRVAVVSTAEPDPDHPSAVPRSFIPQKYARALESGLEAEVVENPSPGKYDFNLK